MILHVKENPWENPTCYSKLLAYCSGRSSVYKGKKNVGCSRGFFLVLNQVNEMLVIRLELAIRGMQHEQRFHSTLKKKIAIRGVGSPPTLGGQSVNSKIEIYVSKFSSSLVLQKN